jgi:hypothetical protein
MPRRFAPDSRYATTEVAVWIAPSGRQIPYLRRRFVPRPDPGAPVARHVVRPGQRLDGLAARYLGDPEQFWVLCDVNGVLRPEELEETGREIVVPLPGVGL